MANKRSMAHRTALAEIPWRCVSQLASVAPLGCSGCDSLLAQKARNHGVETIRSFISEELLKQRDIDDDGNADVISRA
jgi:hypothetical protein